MSAVYRAEDEPVRSRVDWWRQLTGETLAPVDLRVSAADFRSRIVAGEVGASRVFELAIDVPAQVWRTRRLIGRCDPGYCKVDVVVDGQMVVVQRGREAVLGPGDLGFVDLSCPARWANTPARFVALSFPRALLPLRGDEVAALGGLRIAGDRGPGALVSGLVRRMPRHLDDGMTDGGSSLGTAVLDLVTVALAARLDRDRIVPPDTRQRALLARIHAFIEQRLGDSALSPVMVAEAHHISVRYLHKLFAGEAATVAELIRHRRLDRCRRDLLAPAGRTRPVAAVAARWGFASAGQLSRAFRARYGLPPGEYRRAYGRPVGTESVHEV